MKKHKITRVVCLMLAMLFLVSTAVMTVGASGADNTTDKSIEDFVEELNTISYDRYMTDHKEFFGGNPNSSQEFVFDATGGWTFTLDDGSIVESLDNGKLAGKWKHSTPTKNAANETVYNTVEYENLDALVKALNDAGKKVTKYDFSYVDTFDNTAALYTPGSGAVTWNFDLAGKITEAGLYHVELVYYPINEAYIDKDENGKPVAEVVKSASIEREFYINGEAPFAEARSLTLAKIWSYTKADGKTALDGKIVLGKKDDANAILQEAAAAGLSATLAADGKSITFQRPTVITNAIYQFIDKYTLRFMPTDADNNELRPTQIQTPEWATYTLRDSGGFYATALGFVIDPADGNGTLQVSLEGVNESMALKAIVLKPYKATQSYGEYLAGIEKNGGTLASGTDQVKLEGEMPIHTSTNVVYPIEDRASAVTSPADTKRMMLNTIGTEKWSTAGQWIEFDFTVNASGMYEIISRYKQSYLDGMYTSRSLEIYTNYETEAAYKEAHGGRSAGYYSGVPFAEAGQLRYDYGQDWQVTGMTATGNETDGCFQLYFEAGVQYTLRFEVTLGTMSAQVQKIENVLTNLNNDYLSIIKLTGTSPDDYRDYSFSRLLYDTMVDMMNQAKNLKEISAFLQDSAGVASTYSSTCDKLSNLLRKLTKDEDQIAKNLDNLKAYIGNLGTFLTDAKTQPLQLDYIVIQSANAEKPKANENFFQGLVHEFKSFIQSFFRDYNSMGAGDAAADLTTIDVWLAYGRDQSQVIRNLSTNEFTPTTGIAVDLKLVAGGTLLPSILAGMGPDVYLGLDDATVINYAIRGALTSIEEKPGFDEAKDAFIKAAMIQLEIADADGDVHTYGLPEQQTFEMMFVRLDILADLGLEIPKTWEDIYTAQSVLASNNMEIGVTQNYKRFLYQADGDLYADDGMRINLDSQKGLAAFEKMCNMFTQHSFPYQFDPANRFRTGEMPIILSTYTALYNQLKVFATEIDGKWTFVPIPGTEIFDEYGNVIGVNNTADSTITAVVMISEIGEVQEAAAWEFMKWYTGADCQAAYANEMVAIIGDSAKHPTANREALASLPWTRDELAEVEKQFNNLAAIPNYPGSYFIDRHTNFAFLAAYNDDADPTEEILSYINTVNKEITRKREEFNLETLEIGQKLSDKRMNQAMNAIENLAQKYANEKYNNAIAMANYAVKNASTGYASLYDAAKMFEDIRDADYAAIGSPTMEITKVSGKKVTVATYYVNVGKQTAEEKNGGYRIDSLNEEQLVYFIGQCLRDAADAFASYK